MLVVTGRKTCNSWFTYSTRKDPKDIGAPLAPVTDEELDDLERLPRDYDKEFHDSLFHTYICECLAFIVAHIPGRDPLRIAITYQYKPRRIDTPYFIDAWEDNDNEDSRELVLVHLDKHAKSIKKCAVWRPLPRLDNHEERGDSSPNMSTIRWCSAQAKSGMFSDTSNDESDVEDSASDDDCSDDDDDESEGL